MAGNENSGRKPIYRPEFAAQAKKLCEFGMRNIDLAHFFEVSVRSIKVWQAVHAEFGEACKVGKEVADAQVEASLFERATGYSYDAVKIFPPKNGEEPVYAPYVEHVPPDVTACIYWLKNRKPKDWRDRTQHELSGPDGGPIRSEGGGMTDREAARVIARFLLTAEATANEAEAKKQPTDADDDKSAGESV